MTQGSFGGGTDVVIYRELTIHQNRGTTCVFDYYQRMTSNPQSVPVAYAAPSPATVTDAAVVSDRQ